MSKSTYNKLTNNPIFYLHKHEEDIWTQTKENPYGYNDSVTYWVSGDSSIECHIEEEKITFQDDYVMVIADQIIERDNAENETNQTELKTDNNIVQIKIHEASASVEDLIAVLNSCIMRSQNNNDNYSWRDLLWFLHHITWSEQLLDSALQIYSNSSLAIIFSNLKKTGICLSAHKQNQIKLAVAKYQTNYTVYAPEVIKQGVHLIAPQISYERIGLFTAIDYIIGDYIKDTNYPFDLEPKEDTSQSSNILVETRKWLGDKDIKYDNYKNLAIFFSLLNEETQLRVIKRYFHDIRIGNTSFDTELILKFKENRFSYFSKYRHCIETPDAPILLTAPLLCDNILTYIDTKGKEFQSIDGILDFAMVHCDIIKPNIDFGLPRIFPCCHGGAIYNKDTFNGFISFSIVYAMIESKLNREELENDIRLLLDRYAHRKYYIVCSYDNSINPLLGTTLYCKRKPIDGKNEISCINAHEHGHCTKPIFIKDQWYPVPERKSVLPLFNLFLAEPVLFSENESHIQLKELSWEDISWKKFMDNLIAFSDNYMIKVDSGYISRTELLPPILKNILDIFFKPVKMRIIPNDKSIINVGMDIFGIRARYLTEHQELKENLKKIIEEYKKLESAEVRRRVIESLKSELKLSEFNDSYIELAYNEESLRKLKSTYYCGNHKEENSDEQFSFLKRMRLGKYKRFCAPQHANSKNKIIDRAFFWCRGNECFQNNLSGQVLANTSDWNNYTLLHILEIIGYPCLKETDIGFEPIQSVRLFVALVNKAHTKFRRLKCRECGHLMYTDKSSGFNRHNYYTCVNIKCPKHILPVYLSYCFKCKKGLIDSRDSKQCPNGWYICPSCLACCNDIQYERMAQRYIISNRPVPERIKGKLNQGHNNKGIYYCPDCGNLIIATIDEHGEAFKGCEYCHKKWQYSQHD